MYYSLTRETGNFLRAAQINVQTSDLMLSNVAKLLTSFVPARYTTAYGKHWNGKKWDGKMELSSQCRQYQGGHGPPTFFGAKFFSRR